MLMTEHIAGKSPSAGKSTGGKSKTETNGCPDQRAASSPNLPVSGCTSTTSPVAPSKTVANATGECEQLSSSAPRSHTNLSKSQKSKLTEKERNREKSQQGTRSVSDDQFPFFRSRSSASTLESSSSTHSSNEGSSSLKTAVGRQLAVATSATALEDSDDAPHSTPLDKREAKLQRQKQKQLQKQLDKQQAKTKLKSSLSVEGRSGDDKNVNGSEQAATTRDIHFSARSALAASSYLTSSDGDERHDDIDNDNILSPPTLTQLQSLTPVEFCLALRTLTEQLDSLHVEARLRTVLLALAPQCNTFAPSLPPTDTRLSLITSQEITSNFSP
jgi:hypothetical protein